MNVIQTYIKDNILYIFLDDVETIQKVYIDNVDNYKKIQQDDTIEHTKVIDKVYENVKNIAIPLEDINIQACVFTLVINEESEYCGFSYSPEYLYNLQKNIVIPPNCGECKRITHKQKLMVVIFRLMLFTYSFQSNLLLDTVDNYIALMRVLEPEYVPKDNCFYKELVLC